MKLEKEKYQSQSSLEQFCRFDVAVMKDDEENIHYFVNEVERGCNVSLFSHIDPSNVLRLFDGYRVKFIQWIEENKRRLSDDVMHI